MSTTQHAWEASSWSSLTSLSHEAKKSHLRDLLKDEVRNSSLTKEVDGILLDYSRQKLDLTVMKELENLAKETKVHEKLLGMMRGDRINTTEDRSVLHTALRAPSSASLVVEGVDVVKEVHKVLSSVASFTTKVRSGEWRGSTGKILKNVISIGIGGSYLGPEFVFEALRCDPTASSAASGRCLRFLANVDPVDVTRAIHGLDAEETLVIIVSKTFTTAETMLNAKTLREWLVSHIKRDSKAVIAAHMIAVSSNIPATSAFGIDPANVFGFWDWVGGRYSVTSAVGVVPLALHYGMDIVNQFLAGAHYIDNHVANDPLSMPVIMGLLGVWNSTFLGLESRALLPYSQALIRFAAHIQQVDMESNGKRVHLDGSVLPFAAGEVNFGEPGTNGQHSFYQLIHQGRMMACDFIGFIKSQTPIEIKGESVSNHDELMSNFFAQPDALAYGKTIEELAKEGVPEHLRAHKEFPGDRPSLSLLLNSLDAFSCGQLLAIYEHRTAVQGFVWGNNSFDQWGVELGKVLAKQVRNQLSSSRKDGGEILGFNSSTSAMLKRYLS